MTRNAPPKPNKAAIAAGLPEKPDTKSRKKATDIYEGSPSDSKHEDEDQESREGSSIPVSQISSLAPPPSASFAADGDIPVHQTGQHLPPKSNLPPLMPAQMASLGDRPVQRLPLAYSRPSSHAMTSSAKSHKLNAKKKQTAALVYANKPAFDVETSIFDPNNNFGVTTARPLNTRRAGANRSYDNNDVSSDSSLSSDEELDNLFTNRTLANVAGNINVASNKRSLANLSGLNINGMPSLSLPQVSQAFLSKVNYDNAAIEHAAQNPANYDRLPWSAPAIAKSFAATNGQAEDYTHDDTLASLESRLQTISASLRAADAAAAQHAN